MLGHLGFSYVGLVYLLMLFIPNLIWINKKPKCYNTLSESRILRATERTGQFLVTCCAIIFCDFNLKPWSVWNIWLIVSFAFMVLYEIWCVRYFKSQKALKDFYSSILGIPLAGATLPVIAFLLLGIYGKVIWLIIAVIPLAIGHIGIHIQHRKLISKEQ